MILLGEKRENPRPSRPRRPAKNPHALLKEVGELEAGEKSGIRPRNYPRIYDRPPCLTHTHTSNTTYTNLYITSITLSFLLPCGAVRVSRENKSFTRSSQVFVRRGFRKRKSSNHLSTAPIAPMNDIFSTKANLASRACIATGVLHKFSSNIRRNLTISTSPLSMGRKAAKIAKKKVPNNAVLPTSSAH